MSAYFTTHHFSPRWSSPSGSHRDSSVNPAHLTPLTTTTITTPPRATTTTTTATASGDHEQTLSPASAHKLHGLDTLAHFLHVFNTHYNSEDSVTHHGVVHPHFDLAENNTLYAIYGELAGLSKKDVTVEVNDGLFTITISGKLLRLAPPGSLGLSINEPTPDTVGVVHKDESNAGAQTDRAAVEGEKAEEGGKKQQQQQQQQEDDLQWHVTERKVGSFRRAFQFPAQSVDMQGVNATMTNGLLCVTVPKKERKGEEEKGRKVEVS